MNGDWIIIRNCVYVAYGTAFSLQGYRKAKNTSLPRAWLTEYLCNSDSQLCCCITFHSIILQGFHVLLVSTVKDWLNSYFCTLKVPERRVIFELNSFCRTCMMAHNATGSLGRVAATCDCVTCTNQLWCDGHKIKISLCWLELWRHACQSAVIGKLFQIPSHSVCVM
jgi:hypothetical protein